MSTYNIDVELSFKRNTTPKKEVTFDLGTVSFNCTVEGSINPDAAKQIAIDEFIDLLDENWGLEPVVVRSSLVAV